MSLFTHNVRLLYAPGSGGENGQFLPQLTSYDYDAPISEAGASGQPGIGGPNKFQARPSTRQSSCSCQTPCDSPRWYFRATYLSGTLAKANFGIATGKLRVYLKQYHTLHLLASSWSPTSCIKQTSGAAQLIQSVISNHTGNPLPEVPAPLPAAAYGAVTFNESGSLLAALPQLYPGDGIPAFKPASMESYGQP